MFSGHFARADCAHDAGMARIGKSYPRFPSSAQDSPPAPAQPEKPSAFRLLGAMVGLFAALGLIGWLLTR